MRRMTRVLFCVGLLAGSGAFGHTAADFAPENPDGSTCRALAWIHGELARTRPAYDFNAVSNRTDIPAWRGKVRAKLKELLLLSDRPSAPFALLSEERRDGYSLRRYAFSSRPRLVSNVLMLVPDAATNAAPHSVPAVVCVPGTGASLASLAGEPEDRFNRYPIRNRQAYYYAKAGFVAIALENFAAGPLSGGNDIAAFGDLAQMLGVQLYGVAADQVLDCVGFLKRTATVDPKRIAVSGMSLGCFPILYAAVVSDDIAAVVYNDFVCSWAMRYVCTTERSGGYDWKSRDMPGFYRWFDDNPDLLAALVPRPLFLVEDGHGYDCIDKIVRAYALAGASDRLKVRRYPKYADAAARAHSDEDLRKVRGLTGADYLAWSNCDPSQHSFHPEAVLPWLCRTFGMPADFDAELINELKRAENEKERFPRGED